MGPGFGWINLLSSTMALLSPLLYSRAPKHVFNSRFFFVSSSLNQHSMSRRLRKPRYFQKQRLFSNVPRSHNQWDDLETVTSTSNKLVKHLTKLRENRSYREESKTVLLVGQIPIFETLGIDAEGAEVDINPPKLCSMVLSKTLELPAEIDQKLRQQAKRLVVTDQRVLEKIAGLQSGDTLTMAAEVSMPEPFDLLRADGNIRRLVVVDGIQDPGNLGTILRTALGLGWDAVYLLRGTCDPWNSKAIRAARGACFRLPIVTSGTLEDLKHILIENELTIVAADPHAESSVNTLKDTPERVALWLGTEGKGLSAGEWAEIGESDALSATSTATTTSSPNKIPSFKVRIDMDPRMESLNVAVAGAILMHLFRPKTFSDASLTSNLATDSNDNIEL